jgi:hypothetical protein
MCAANAARRHAFKLGGVMARLFIHHKPVECEVDLSVLRDTFYVHRDVLYEHGLRVEGPNNTGVNYVCFVSNGNCWAAQTFKMMGNKQVCITCVPFNDDPSGQEMILADMILN